MGTVNPEPVTGIQTHPAVSVRPYAAARIKRNAAVHGGQVGQDVMCTSAQPFLLRDDGSKVPLPGISADELDIVDNPVADGEDPFPLHTHFGKKVTYPALPQ